MTGPQDPFAAPDPTGEGQLPGYEQPGYGQPGYGQTPLYGQLPYGQASQSGWQGPPLASWGRRVGGSVIDTVLSAIAQTLVGFVSRPLGQVFGFAILLYFGYLTGTTGQTPGRRVMGTRVLRERDGQPLGAGAGIGRAFLHILDVLSLGLGYLWPLWDAKKQTFADKAIHSVVIKL